MADLVICEYQQLKDIADAVRGLSGEEGGMAINDIAAVIEGAGGGSVTFGTVSPASASNITIEHGLATKPKAMLWSVLPSSSSVPSTKETLYWFGQGGYTGSKGGIRIFTYSSTTPSVGTLSVSNTNASFGLNTASPTNNDRIAYITETSFRTPSDVIVGNEYLWVAFGEEVM